MIKKVPFPICGVMLGTAALGNLLQSYSDTVRNVCGILAAFLLVLILLKLVKYPSTIKEDLDTPVMAGVAATFPMALMILSTYVKPFIGQGSYFVWVFAIVLHVILIVYFTAKFLLKYDQKKVFTTWFIVYVGIAVAGVTAPAYGKTGFGAATFWFGLITLIPLLVIVIKRYAVHPLPEPVKPLSGIFAAPYEPLHRSIYSIGSSEELYAAYGDVRSRNSTVCIFSSCLSWIAEEVLSELCGFHIPFCNQCDCYKADDGMFCPHGASTSMAKQHSSSRDSNSNGVRSICVC